MIKSHSSKIKTTGDFLNERSSRGKNVGIINLGCARNLVDSQVMLGDLKRKGHRIVDVGDADIAIVNTCGFIKDAKRESIDTIIDLLELKKQGKLKKVIVAGCLAERYGKELAHEFKDIDTIIGVQKLDREKIPEQVSLTPKHFAYLKVCESCYNQCSFCVIPKIKGKFVSRTIESVVQEAKQMDQRAVKEINIIGQDITAYGMDIYRAKSLAKLIRTIAREVKNIEWIRLLYAFPAHMTDELIETIAAEEKICKYIDMPLQHISDSLLKSMNRNITTRGTIDLIGKIRAKMSQATIRTTFIVGLPGETDKNFEELVNFVKQSRFDKMGVFVYSREEGTSAYAMADQIPERIKKQRLDILMKAQQDISKTLQEKYLGQNLKVLIEERLEPENSKEFIYLGRSQYDAHEVDGVVYVHSPKEIKVGEFVHATITDSLEYDLVGKTL